MMSSRSPAPAIDTERLAMRGHTLDDYADCVALWSDPRVVRYIGGRPFTPEETWARVLRYVGHWDVRGFGYWVVRERATGDFVGEVGLADFKRDLVPSFEGAPEAGWVLAPSAHGRGFATEAVRAVLAWLEGHRGPTRTVCMINPENLASLRVAAKCGFRPWTRASYKGSDVLLFER
jgi:RimJ/RimL family protein N-acetyltransferase